MGRWKDDPQGRLGAAAFTLFTTQGFQETTAAQIAASAGLHERSFFRHFKDKRDVVFLGWDGVVAKVLDAMVTTPSDVTALDTVVSAMKDHCRRIDATPDLARTRFHLIMENPVLDDYNTVKHLGLATEMAEILAKRGENLASAELLCQAVVLTFRQTVRAWTKNEEPGPLAELLEHRFTALRQLMVFSEPCPDQAGHVLRSHI
ncbi:TetR/AcrR family transcriptional regulator [Lysinibacter sp. HNR]|uniref:TetR/AcrR family transcriptional regulator n=1 Tax=Lysinibacter sp. HNR TaxID=3031408 RepID=UPI00243521D8|nr:TetR/AcrR family transcriptional regulator [Lysinibacter sp. HNR]WGD36875.1 TetR/AcrR family transcriptional regulator [Lysinibacter sp. HNR]